VTRTVLHLVPYDTVGGVETALRSVPAQWEGPEGPVRFRRAYLVTHSAVEIFPNDFHGAAVSVNHPMAHWRLLRAALRSRADLVVASLWRSCPVFIVLKLLRPRTKTVLFLHSAVDVHVFDWLLNRLAMRLADEIWADSVSTLEARAPKGVQGRGRVLSFLTRRPAAMAEAPAEAYRPAPDFIYWGRLQEEKNLERALEVFAAIRARLPRARFDVFGPDRGALPGLEARVAELGLGAAVCFPGALPQNELLARAGRYSFYLQTSRFEGMAMSVIEAMAAGLVPVVTPVGEIPRYCHDGQSGIHVTTAEHTARRVAEIATDPVRWRAISDRATATWKEARLFRDDYRAACNALLSQKAAPCVD
jgi:glycosyltransferase involved in cell wall biosynthesis